ncbi:SPFH domain-containing protein [Streptomyces prasinus]|uniref:SPFH domain-containing protein n=1 Tax=Streptomyces prasinus TaxID=67345 RepID=UPI0037D2BE16
MTLTASGAPGPSNAPGTSGPPGVPRTAHAPSAPGPCPPDPHTSDSPDSPDPPGSRESRVPGSGGPVAGERSAAGRSGRLIRAESITEIPAHLLFRDDPDQVPARPRATVVGRRRGTGEQPRLRRPAAEAFRSSVPRVDPRLAERPARVLPGGAGVLAGTCGVAGCVATSWWAGVLPPTVTVALGLPAHAGLAEVAGVAGAAGAAGLGPAQWAAYAAAGALGLFGFGGLARGRAGRAWVLGLFGRYRGTVRRTGLLWVNPLLLRRRVDVRLRHWRSEPMQAVDRGGVALRVVVLVVWRVRDTARVTLGVEDHERYVRECVEAALLRVRVEAPGGAAGTAQDALTRLVAADAGPVGIEVFAVRPVRVEYAPEVAEAMHRRRIAELDARQRASALASVVESVEDTVSRLALRGLVDLDDHERKALVKDLAVAFCAGRGEREP